MTARKIAAFLLAATIAGPAVAHDPEVVRTIEGAASWYGPGLDGNLTASGETFDQGAMTAAHRTLPFDTLVRVTNDLNGESVTVRINDRGPYAHGRTIDLSRAAARELGFIRRGVADVTIEVLAD